MFHLHKQAGMKNDWAPAKPAKPSQAVRMTGVENAGLFIRENLSQ